MTALAIQNTVPAYPLGRPVDGRPRYSMTGSQAKVYAWLRQNRPHDEPFLVRFEALMEGLGYSTKDNLFLHVSGLVERGWLERVAEDGRYTRYAFVHPIMTFQGPRNG